MPNAWAAKPQRTSGGRAAGGGTERIVRGRFVSWYLLCILQNSFRIHSQGISNQRLSDFKTKKTVHLDEYIGAVLPSCRHFFFTNCAALIYCWYIIHHNKLAWIWSMTPRLTLYQKSTECSPAESHWFESPGIQCLRKSRPAMWRNP